MDPKYVTKHNIFLISNTLHILGTNQSTESTDGDGCI